MTHSFNSHKEPEEIFLPIDTELYARFYSIEMDHFTQDIQFYQENCQDSTLLLELGCGTGRISHALGSKGFTVIGLDLSLDMLRRAHEQHGHTASWVCMDMTEMAFCSRFDHILLPYNTLNLLHDRRVIGKCLRRCHDHLKEDGFLLAQIHIPDSRLSDSRGEKLFQFQIFPMADGGKLIKETLRSHDPGSQEIILEERYRPRPAVQGGSRDNFHHTLRLAGFSLQQWLQIFNENGFPAISLHGDYNSRPFNEKTDTTLLLKASPGQ